jgi:Cysteine-rich CWC
MSICERCGATFHCAMADPGPDGKLETTPCWCTALPPVVPVPAVQAAAVGCWCPACLRAHIAARPAPAIPS